MGPMSKLCPRACRAGKRRGGFSLLELLVALTILAIALVPVAYFYSKSLQMVEQASIRTRALALARERLTEIQQMPYERIHSNVTPTKEQLMVYGGLGTIDTYADDWFGYDFEANGGSWRAMFSYPLPLDYNPYQPQTQGYNNTIGAQHFANYNPENINDPNVNFNAGGAELDYEYEPIGFYTDKIYHRSRQMGFADQLDIRMADRRSVPGIEPSLAGGQDYFRSGTRLQVDKYEIYGRRTIILDVLPTPLDLDGGDYFSVNHVVGADGYAPDDDFDGNASAVNPYPLAKGPDNKFQVLSRHGTRGKMVIVQVFWLPRDAGQRYLRADELNVVELRSFIAANNIDSSMESDTGELNRNDYLIVTPPL